MNENVKTGGLTEERLKDLENKALIFIGFLLASFHIYTAYFGTLPAYQHRTIFLYLSMMMIPLSRKFKFLGVKGKLVFDIVIIAFFAYLLVFCYQLSDILWKQTGVMSNLDMVLSAILVVLLLYFTWKVVGPALPIISIIVMLYARFGNYLPRGLGHRGYSWARILETLFKGVNGIFGTSLGAASVYVGIFVVFAALLETCGAGDVFINMTQSMIGMFRGGPAKVAVVASGLFGTISGSAVANVVGTGTFTIPLMKKTGFKSEFAGAVETAASTGGQLMPPVMGAAAFIMADYLGSYSMVIAAAIIPAIVYYVALFIMIDLQSIKDDLKGQPKSELPRFTAVMKDGGYLLLPLLLLIFMLVIIRYSAQKSAFFAIVLLFALCLFWPGKHMPVKTLLTNIGKSARGIPATALTTGTAGIIVSMLMLTGIGYKLSSILIDVSGGQVLVLLLLTMVVSIILGMGMPTSAAYILLATLIVPALTDMGIEKIAAHFFVFYFGIMANITPPVAIASYAAASIAESSAMKTGFLAWRLALAGFLMPFMWCFNPAILGIGSGVQIAVAAVSGLLGAFALACALQRYFKGDLSLLVSGLFLVGAVCSMIPGTLTDVIGLACIAAAVAWQLVKGKKTAAA